MFASARKSIGGMFIGIDPSQESPDQNLFINSIRKVELFPDTEGRHIIIGYKMAEKLNLGLGKKLVYTTTDVNGEIVSEIARVSGIFKTGVSEVDGAMALLPLNNVRSTLNYGEQDATLVAVTIEDHRHSDDVRDKIEKAVGSPIREVLSWKQTQPEVAGLVRIDRSANYISQFLIGILIAAGILNTVLMSVLERTREFGVMMAVGMSPSKLFKLVLVESVWLAFIGIVIGVIITTPWYVFMYNIGIDFSGAIGDDYSAGGVLVDPVMKIRLYKESITVILFMVFTLTILSGLYPAWKAGRIPPVESLRAM
jgi:ABC-type lipoprotein release transport system permease subunit